MEIKTEVNYIIGSGALGSLIAEMKVKVDEILTNEQKKLHEEIYKDCSKNHK